MSCYSESGTPLNSGWITTEDQPRDRSLFPPVQSVCAEKCQERESGGQNVPACGTTCVRVGHALTLFSHVCSFYYSINYNTKGSGLTSLPFGKNKAKQEAVPQPRQLWRDLASCSYRWLVHRSMNEFASGVYLSSSPFFSG